MATKTKTKKASQAATAPASAGGFSADDASPDDCFYRVVKRTDDSLTENGEINDHQWLQAKLTLSIKFGEERRRLCNLLVENEAEGVEFLPALRRASHDFADEEATVDDWVVKVNAQDVFHREKVNVEVWRRTKLHFQIFVDSILTGMLVEDVMEDADDEETTQQPSDEEITQQPSDEEITLQVGDERIITSARMQRDAADFAMATGLVRADRITNARMRRDAADFEAATGLHVADDSN